MGLVWPFDVGLGEWVNGRQWALCGKLAPDGDSYGVSAFDDLDLCRKCVSMWPYDQVLLFEHELDRQES